MKWYLLWLGVLLSTRLAGADPCQQAGDGDFYAGAGGVPGPAEERDVRMASETVEFVESADGATWAVKAHYVFENLTDAAVGRVMLFPWAAADESCQAAQGDVEEEELQEFDVQEADFVARVNGTAVRVTLEKNVRCAGGKRYKFGHRFELQFAPQARVELDCEYGQKTSPKQAPVGFGLTEMPCPCRGVEFILETGALWQDPIGEIVFRYRFAVPTVRILFTDRWPENDWYQCPIRRLSGDTVRVAGVRFGFELSCTGNTAVATLTAHDVEPTGRVAMVYNDLDFRRRLLALQGCPLDGPPGAPGRDCCAAIQQRVETEPLAVQARESPGHTAWRWLDAGGQPQVPAPATADGGPESDDGSADEGGEVAVRAGTGADGGSAEVPSRLAPDGAASGAGPSAPARPKSGCGCALPGPAHATLFVLAVAASVWWVRGKRRSTRRT